MPEETVPSIEVPNDNSVPAKTDTPTLLGADPKETFRNAMKAEADREGARSQRTDAAEPTPEAKPTKTEAKTPEKPAPTADDIPESLLKPAKTDEPPPDDTPPELHGNTSKSVREHFAKQGDYYKGKLKTLGDELAAARKELEGAKSSNGKPSAEHLSMLEAVTKQRDELNATLERVAYEQSPKFRELFTAKEERLRAVAEKIFEDVGADKSILNQALAMNGKRRDEFLDEQDLGYSTKARLSSVLAGLDVLAEDRAAELLNSRERLAGYRAEAAAREKAMEEAQLAEEKAIEEQVRKHVSENSIPFRKAEGNDAWNKAVDERFAQVEEILHGNLDHKTIVDYAFAAVAAKTIDRLNQKLTEKVAALEAKLGELSAVEPGINGRDKPAATDAEREAGITDPNERARLTFRRLAAPYVGH